MYYVDAFFIIKLTVEYLNLIHPSMLEMQRTRNVPKKCTNNVVECKT